ncbi:MAG: hypothetical protein H6609_18850 [Ignavibacteriales bacterium]|nr:hypothetical protein [Ignavibacteriales bacterium]
MKITSSYLKTISLISAALILLVAILIALFVIQPVAVDTYKGVPHDKIIFIWGVNISINIFIAYSLVMISLAKKGLGWIIATVVLLFIVFILAFIYIDAASAYSNHGSEMQSAVVILFICVVIEVVVWLLMLSTLLFRKKIMLQN